MVHKTMEDGVDIANRMKGKFCRQVVIINVIHVLIVHSRHYFV